MKRFVQLVILQLIDKMSLLLFAYDLCVFYGWLIRLSRMASLLLLSSMPIGVKYAGN